MRKRMDKAAGWVRGEEKEDKDSRKSKADEKVCSPLAPKTEKQRKAASPCARRRGADSEVKGGSR